MDDDEVIRRFGQIWWERNASTFFVNQWLGVPAFQNPFDFWITQEIIAEVRPDVIVESGTWHGGSAVAWATVLEQVNPEGQVLTIDVNKDIAPQAFELPVVKRMVTFITGDSTAAETVERARSTCSGRRVLVILDSDHHRDHVLSEIHAYAPLVSAGSYLIVQDGFVNGHPVEPDYGPGPYEAVREFLASDDRFEPDQRRERLLFTFCPGGYLRRVR